MQLFKVCNYGHHIREEAYIRVPPRETRAAQKVVFIVPTRILPGYKHLPYYKGTFIWNGLCGETQKIDNVFAFKKEIDKLSNVTKLCDMNIFR